MKILINLFIILFLNVSFINSMNNRKGKGIVGESSGKDNVVEVNKRKVYPSKETQIKLIKYFEELYVNFGIAYKEFKKNKGKWFFNRLSENLLVDFIRGIIGLYKYGEVGFEQLVGIRHSALNNIMKAHNISFFSHVDNVYVKPNDINNKDFKKLKIELINYYVQIKFDNFLEGRGINKEEIKQYYLQHNFDNNYVYNLVKNNIEYILNNSQYPVVQQQINYSLLHNNQLINYLYQTGIGQFFIINDEEKNLILNNWIDKFIINKRIYENPNFNESIFKNNILNYLNQHKLNNYLIQSEIKIFIKGEYRIIVNEQTIDKLLSKQSNKEGNSKRILPDLNEDSNETKEEKRKQEDYEQQKENQHDEIHHQSNSHIPYLSNTNSEQIGVNYSGYGNEYYFGIPQHGQSEYFIPSNNQQYINFNQPTNTSNNQLNQQFNHPWYSNWNNPRNQQ